jgi:hypothetical protein
MHPRKTGAALLLAIMVVVIVMGLGFTFLMIVWSAAKGAETRRLNDEAEGIAESAVTLGRRFLFVYITQGTWSIDDILQYNSGFPTDPNRIRNDALEAVRLGRTVPAATWPEAPLPPDLRVPSYPPTVFGAYTVYGGAVWHMVVRDDDDDGDPLRDSNRIVRLIVTGVTPSGGVRQLEAHVAYVPPMYTPLGAVVAGGSVRIVGNPKITALPGVRSADVVSNVNIEISGSARIEGRAVASGAVQVDGSPDIRDGVVTGAPRATLPRIDPESYRALATVQFGSNGLVKDALGNVLSAGQWFNFEFKGGMWRAEKDFPPPPPGIFFFETSLKISGRARYEATLISKGDIELTGQAGAGDPLTFSSYLQNVALLSGGDISAAGRARVKGFLLAREQMDLSGTVDITEGGLVIADEGDSSRLVGRSSIGGTVTIEYRDNLPTFLKLDQHSMALQFIRRIK